MKKIILAVMALGAIISAGAQTTRELVVKENNGKTKTFLAEEVDGILFEAQPEYIKLNEAYDASYEEVGSIGLYGITFATNIDNYGNPASSEDLVASLLLAGPWSDDVKNPVLPAGYYRVGRSEAEWTFDVTKSSITVLGESGPSPSMIINGTVDVRDEGEGIYDIRMEFTMFTGATVDMRYQGPIEFPAGYSDYEPFTEPVDVTFAEGQGRFWGNWYYPFAADLMLQFYDGTVEDGYLTEGYMLDIYFFEPKPENEMDPNQRVADGTYTVETRDAVAYTYLPFRYEAGRREEFMGTTYISKTRIAYYGSDGTRKLGLIKGGTFTVSENGSKFEFDFVTEEGVSIKGRYDRLPGMYNACDNDEKAPQRPYSTLSENIELNWQEGTVALSYNEGASILDNVNTMMLMIVHPSQAVGDYISIDLLTESEDLPDGTFVIGEGLEADHIIPGEVDYGRQMLFSWYGDLGEVDPDGYNTKLAPLSGGTVTISTLPDGQRKIEFDAMDDAGHDITGSFTGYVINVNDEETEETAIPAKSIIKNQKRNRGVKVAARIHK